MTRRETAQKILQAFALQLGELGVDVPGRQYVAPGQAIVWDGEQLTVALQAGQQGKPGAPYAGTYVPGTQTTMSQWAVAIVREVPALSGEGAIVAQLPSAEDLNESGLAAMDDAEALERVGYQLHTRELITELGMDFAVGPLQSVGPEGGLAGHRLLLETTVH